jgi:hypothetical protein
MLSIALVLVGFGVAAATISSAAAAGGGTSAPPPTTGTTTSTDPTDTSTDPTDTSTDPTETATDPTTTETTPTGTPPIVPPVLPGAFGQAVTTTVVVGAPITVAGTISNTTVINNPAPDICSNLPDVQSSVPAGHVLTFAKSGALICVTPTIARSLHPAAVPIQVPAGSRIVFPKRGGGLCVGHGRASAKPVIVPATTSAKEVLILAKSGKLVCLGP